MTSVGFAETCLNEGLKFPMGGAFQAPFFAKSVRDDLYASAFALENDQARIVWIGCDLSLIPDTIHRRIARRVHEHTGIPETHVITSATHTHSGPEMLEDVFFSESTEAFFAQPHFAELEKRIVAACVAAWESRGPAHIGAASSTVARCSGNRRYLMSDGTLGWQPLDPLPDGLRRVLKEGPEDTRMQVIWFSKPNEAAIGEETLADIQFAIVNFTAHPSNYYGQPHISADYPGVVRQMIRETIGNIPVMFLQGNLGNVHCIDFDNADWFKNTDDRVIRVGRVLGAEAVKQMLTAATRPMDDLPIRFGTSCLELPFRPVGDGEMKTARTFAANLRKGTAKIPPPEEAAALYRNCYIARKRQFSDRLPLILNVLAIDDIVFATNPAELFVEFQLEMRENIRAGVFVPCSITNGHTFYTPTRKAFTFGGYETELSLFGPEAGERIAGETIALARRVLHNAMVQRETGKDDL